MRFQAQTVKILVEDEVTILAFGDEGETPSVGVILSVSDDDDEQDKVLGIDGLYFEAIHANVSGYHLVSSLTFDGSLVQIEMKPSVQEIDHLIEIEANDQSCDRASLLQIIEKMRSHVL